MNYELVKEFECNGKEMVIIKNKRCCTCYG